MKELESKAKNIGYKEIFIYTSVAEKPNWLSKYGWEILKTDSYQNHPITVMRKTLKR